MSKHLVMDVAGTSLPLMEVAVLDKETHEPRADGRTYFAFCDYDASKQQFKRPSRFGVPWAPLSKKLPTSIKVDGLPITLNHGLTAAEYNGKPQVQREKASFQGVVTLPSIGEERTLSVSISVTSDGLWNIKANVTRKSTASPEDKQAKAKDKAQAAKDAFAAIFAQA